MIDLCKIFGVEEGEEFNIEYEDEVMDVCTFKIVNGYLYDTMGYEYCSSPMEINILAKIKNIIKLPKKKEFTDDELAIMRSLPKGIKWIARDKTENVFCYESKPIKVNGIWCREKGKYHILRAFDHMFKEITTEDKEPIFIDDYVERGVE